MVQDQTRSVCQRHRQCMLVLRVNLIPYSRAAINNHTMVLPWRARKRGWSQYSNVLKKLGHITFQNQGLYNDSVPEAKPILPPTATTHVLAVPQQTFKSQFSPYASISGVCKRAIREGNSQWSCLDCRSHVFSIETLGNHHTWSIRAALCLWMPPFGSPVLPLEGTREVST